MIRDVLLLQKRELEKRLAEDYVERDARVKQLDTGLVKVIMGPRRAGKSFFAVHALREAGGGFAYANFDDEKLVGVKNYDEIVDALKSVYGNPKRFLFDEIQNLAGWELFVNRLQRQGLDLVVTGSNARLLSKELATHLTGRHSLSNVFPFSFKEFLRFKEKGVGRSGLTGSELTESEVKTAFLEYLTRGGYPEPLVKKMDYDDYLSTLFNAVIYKDVVKRFRVRNPQGIEDLASYLVSNVAKEFSFNALTKVTKCKSVSTVEKYLGYLEEAFLFFTVPRFSFKVREQAAFNKKVYCVDNGFVNAKAFKLSPDNGKLLENLVGIELLKLEASGAAKIYFWKSSQGGEEVDFVVRRGTRVTELVQACFDAGDAKTRDREARALVKAGAELDCKNLVVVTTGLEERRRVSWFGRKAVIRFVPAWKWLLENGRDERGRGGGRGRGKNGGGRKRGQEKRGAGKTAARKISGGGKK